MFRLYQNPGWGSAIVEAQLALYGLPYDLIEAGDTYTSANAERVMARVNPLAQVPTLELPGGEVMTESAAITLYLADVAGRDDLVPGPGSTERAAFLRWLIFLVANVYPVGSFHDRADQYLSKAEDVEEFRRNAIARRGDLWRIVAGEASRRSGPWFLGTCFSAIDIYIAVMTHWRPGPDWFASETPGLTAIAARVAARPDLRAVFARNYG